MGYREQLNSLCESPISKACEKVFDNSNIYKSPAIPMMIVATTLASQTNAKAEDNNNKNKESYKIIRSYTNQKTQQEKQAATPKNRLRYSKQKYTPRIVDVPQEEIYERAKYKISKIIDNTIEEKIENNAEIVQEGLGKNLEQLSPKNIKNIAESAKSTNKIIKGIYKKEGSIKVYNKTLNIENATAAILGINKDTEYNLGEIIRKNELYQRLGISNNFQKKVFEEQTKTYLKIANKKTPRCELDFVDVKGSLKSAAFLGYREGGKFGGKDKRGKFAAYRFYFDENISVTFKHYIKDGYVSPVLKGENSGFRPRNIYFRNIKSYMPKKTIDILNAFKHDQDKIAKAVSLALKMGQIKEKYSMNNINFTNLFKQGKIKIEGQKDNPSNPFEKAIFGLKHIFGSRQTKEMMNLSKRDYSDRINQNMFLTKEIAQKINKEPSLSDQELAYLDVNHNPVTSLVENIKKTEWILKDTFKKQDNSNTKIEKVNKNMQIIIPSEQTHKLVDIIDFKNYKSLKSELLTHYPYDIGKMTITKKSSKDIIAGVDEKSPYLIIPQKKYKSPFRIRNPSDQEQFIADIKKIKRLVENNKST